jgi:hypothetical protein
MLGTIEQQQQSSINLLSAHRGAAIRRRFRAQHPPDEELFHQLAFE